MPIKKKTTRRKPMSAKDIIRKEYGKSKNFVTPDVLKYGKIKKNKAYELSGGRGIFSDNLYGVSVVSVNSKGKTKRSDRQSKVFRSKSKALTYINRLKKKR